jgi:hypothetical protein
MSVVVRLAGRLGDNVFQYALGRIIAQHLGLALRCEATPVPRLNSRGDADVTLREAVRWFPNAPLTLPGKDSKFPVERYELSDIGPACGNTIDLKAILANPEHRQIKLRGMFQRYEYYYPYRHDIRRWFHTELVSDLTSVRDNDILIDLARGVEYGLYGWTLPLTYYEEIIESIPDRGRVFVCGSGICSKVRERLSKFNPVFYAGSMMEQFALFARFRILVLSNTTFAWWAAFLSGADCIFGPSVAHGNIFGFSGFRDVELNMRDPRYREVLVERCAPFAMFVRNPAAKLVCEGDGSKFWILDLGPGVPRITEVASCDADLLRWLFRQAGPITIRDLRRRCESGTVSKCIAELVAARVLFVQPFYVE